MQKKSVSLLLLLSFFTLSSKIIAQVVTPFNNRYQAIQNGNLVFVSNSIITCDGSAAGCNAAKNEVAPAGTSSAGGFTSQYIDVDGISTTFSSSSSSLSLPSCSQVTFAALYWGGRISALQSSYANRNKVSFRSPASGSYSSLTADILTDNSAGDSTYHCYKDVTALVQGAGSGSYMVADMVASTGVTGSYGGWTMVVAYSNPGLSLRKIVVSDGLFLVNNANTLNLALNGFSTPALGNVAFSTGLVSYKGRRSVLGDSLLFNDAAGSFVPVFDASHPGNDIFNSTISSSGANVATRNPSNQNTLGYNSDLFMPDNSAKDFLGNSQSTAFVRVKSSTDPILVQVVATALDVAAANLDVIKSVTDVNGGLLNPGDTLLYLMDVTNNGTDNSTETVVLDTLPYNVDYVVSSLQVVSGANSGSKTDKTDSDQAEYNASGRWVRFRVGTGANSTTGGLLPNTALSSTSVQFKAVVTSICEKLYCNNQIANQGYARYSNTLSSFTSTAASHPAGVDGSGCTRQGTTNIAVNVPASCVPPGDTSIAVCAPYSFKVNLASVRPGYKYYNSVFSSSTGASSSGTFYGIKVISPTCVDTFVIHYTSQNPNITGTTLTHPTCTNGGVNAGRVRMNGLNGTDSIAYCLGSSFTSGTYSLGTSMTPPFTVTGLSQNTYTVRVKNSYGCVANRTVNINYINCTPVTADEYFTILATDILDYDVSLNDNEPDADSMTFSLVTPPTYGSLVFNADGTFTYTPHATFRGTETFVYRGADNRSPSLGSNAVVHITITSPLPVEMTMFNATLNKEGTLLKWQTASELNNDHFELERSRYADKGFEQTGEIEGNGTTNEVHNYAFSDRTPLHGRNYYRLKQVDYNNEFSYSKVISVDNGLVISQEIIPNPNNGSFKLVLNSNIADMAQIAVVSQYGQQCYNEEVRIENHLERKIFLGPKAKGVYFVVVTQGETISRLRFVVQ